MINKLQAETECVVRNSDKGGNIVSWAKEKYWTEAYKQLNNLLSYRKVSKELSISVQMKFTSELQVWRDKALLSHEEYLFLKTDHSVTPKIHKDRENPPGRPIISAIGSTFENTSKYVDRFLGDFVRSLPSYIQDTGDFLCRIYDLPWEEDYVLITVDVTTMY